MMELLLLLPLWLYVVFQLFVWSGFVRVNQTRPALTKYPRVAVLVPARNEEQHIIRCLNSLLELNYPAGQLEIHIGEDGSTDATPELLREFVKTYPQVKVHVISGNIGSARAKGNVLAQLVKATDASFLFVTDADILVGKDWIRALLPWLSEAGCGIVSGTTLVDGKSLFEQYQGMEWTLGNGYLIGLDRLGIRSTAAGNNMAFTREAYQATGGFENMPFSVTEDFQLFRAIRSKGYPSMNLMERASLNHSAAQQALQPLLHQRKRWMQGARDLPWFWVVIFGLQAAFYPVLLVMFLINAKLALNVWVVKYLVQTLFLLRIQMRMDYPLRLHVLLTYECYSLMMHWMMMGFYLAPVKMDWKGRQY